MKHWLQQTHGPTFELLRHFLLRFFDSEFITTPGQMLPVLLGALPVVFQWFFLLISPLRHKYIYLSKLPSPIPYREAVRADELWLITLMMSSIGLLTAIKWQNLFPDLRDYRVLGTLPLRPLQIFGSKLAALLLVAAAALVTVNFLPSIGFPALSTGRWALQPSVGARVLAHTEASVAACCFFFFGLVGLQGVLLNLLRPRVFGRVAGYAQGCMVGLMLGLVVTSFSIEPKITNALLKPEWARWLPPIWFLGLYQTLAGDTDRAMGVLAGRALAALGIAVTLALLSYLVSYHRHRTLLLEGSSAKAKRRPLPAFLACSPRRQAILAFMMQTLGRSNQHRMILMGYGGLGLALLLTGIAGMGSAFKPARVLAADFVYYHVLAILLLLVGARHLFSLPTELKANWVFQIMEGDGRIEWLHAVDRFVLVWGAAPLVLLPFPVEIRLLGARGFVETTLLLLLGLLVYEWTFSTYNKLPFTCSRLPGTTPVWLVLATFGLFGALGLLHSLLLAALYNETLFATLLILMLPAWWHFRRTRRQNREEVRLKYEESPDLEIHALNLSK
jgi:hypothetical protein